MTVDPALFLMRFISASRAWIGLRTLARSGVQRNSRCCWERWGGLTGPLLLTRLSVRTQPQLYEPLHDPRFFKDRFGVLATGELGQLPSLRTCFLKAGAEQLKKQL